MAPEQEALYYNRVYSQPYDDTGVYLPLYSRIHELAGDINELVDLGCGIGGLLFHWPEPRPDVMLGVDFSDTAIAIAQSRVHDAGFFIRDLRTWVPHNKYDVGYELVTCIETLEHLDEDVHVFRMAQEIGNRVICSVPFDDMIPSEGHVDERYYTEDMVTERFGEMAFMERLDKFLIFGWDGEMCDG